MGLRLPSGGREDNARDRLSVGVDFALANEPRGRPPRSAADCARLRLSTLGTLRMVLPTWFRCSMNLRMSALTKSQEHMRTSPGSPVTEAHCVSVCVVQSRALAYLSYRCSSTRPTGCSSKPACITDTSAPSVVKRLGGRLLKCATSLCRPSMGVHSGRHPDLHSHAPIRSRLSIASP